MGAPLPEEAVTELYEALKEASQLSLDELFAWQRRARELLANYRTMRAATQPTAMPEEEVMRRARFHVEGQTSTVGQRWQIWDGEKHFARFQNIADEGDAAAICAELNALSTPIPLRPNVDEPCPSCKGNGYSGGVIPDEPELCDACEVCLGKGMQTKVDEDAERFEAKRIVAGLRIYQTDNRYDIMPAVRHKCGEAADLIEQLEAEIASLRDGLALARKFIGGGSYPDDPAIKLLQTDIDALLKGQGK